MLPQAATLLDDNIQCTPIFEIRETQSGSAAINQFGNGHAGLQDAAGQYPSVSTAPPFNIDIPAQSVGAFTTSQTSSHMQLPTRDRSVEPNRYTPGGVVEPPAGFNLGDSNAMDTSSDGILEQPSPATTNAQSRGGSTSHTSYSPGGQQQAYRASPKNLANQVPLAHSTTITAITEPSFEDMFAGNMYSHPGSSTDGNSMGNGFIMTQDWDLSAMGTGAELPPMSEGSWNQMLESINLGWDAVGPPRSYPQ